MIVHLTIAKEVQAAIDNGADTLQKIRRRTKRNDDEVGDALAYLLLTTQTTLTETRNGKRLYLPARVLHAPFSDAPLSFSSLRGLMPRARSLNLV